MRPEVLIGITSYNRKDLLIQTVEALRRTARPDQYRLCIVDNGSTDGSREWLKDLTDGTWVWLEDRNVGCPQALNRILTVRRRLQPFVKLDNDVEILTEGWIDIMWDYMAAHPKTALLGATYDGVLGPDECRLKEETPEAYLLNLLPGHFVWHDGDFLDRVGYFDVLHEKHLYGFEDWIMCAKAWRLSRKIAVLKRVEMRDLQKPGKYAPVGGKDKREHSEVMRPLFNERLLALRQGWSQIYTPPSGVPIIHVPEPEAAS